MPPQPFLAVCFKSIEMAKNFAIRQELGDIAAWIPALISGGTSREKRPGGGPSLICAKINNAANTAV
jgi:hypothetical protein